MDPALAMLNDLLGAWRGSGSVETPTVPALAFSDEIRFWRRNGTSINYYQRAVRADGQLSHSEVGVWRLGAPGRLEITVALAGSTEVAEGAVIDGSIETATTAVGRATTSTRFMGARRRYHLDGDTLNYEVDLASVNFPMTFHLRAVVTRIET